MNDELRPHLRADAPDAAGRELLLVQSRRSLLRSPAALFRVLAGTACASLALLSASTVFSAEPATAMVEKRQLDISFPAPARVEAVRESVISAQVGGRVLAVGVDAGDAVRRGQLLVTLDAREAEGNAAANAAGLAQAEASWQRSQNLYRQKFISKAALDQAEAAYKAAKGSAQSADATMSHARITSPLTGIVAERRIEPGEVASPGTPLLSVFDPTGLRVIASVPQYHLDAVRATKRARIELVESGRWIDAASVEVLPTIDAQSHTATVRLNLPKNVVGIVPGMAVRAHLATGAGQKLVVPLAAVLRRGEVTALYVIGDEGKVRLRQVRLGEPVGEGLVEVLAGVGAGERVSLDPVRSGINNNKG